MTDTPTPDALARALYRTWSEAVPLVNLTDADWDRFWRQLPDADRAGWLAVAREVAALRAALQGYAVKGLTSDEFGQHCEFCTWFHEDYEALPQHDDACVVLLAASQIAVPEATHAD
jgi:hypothetical protein